MIKIIILVFFFGASFIFNKIGDSRPTGFYSINGYHIGAILFALIGIVQLIVFGLLLLF